jgi:hypothetical protein
MPGRGFEPPRSFTSTATSTRRVCQFRHPGVGGRQYRVESADVECLAGGRLGGRYALGLWGEVSTGWGWRGVSGGRSRYNPRLAGGVDPVM